MKININFIIIIFSNINLFLSSFINKTSKVALIATVKMENIYLREFIEHYKSLEVDNIILIDNNNEEGERFEEVIYDYIQSEFVIVENYRNCSICQMKSYEECYYKYKNYYEWLMFFDVDEYLILPNYKNIHEFLEDEKFKNFNIIHINWIFYDDNNLIFYDNRPLQKRFIRPRHLIDKNFTNTEKKSIIRTVFWNIDFKHAHSPKGKYTFRICDVTGKNIKNKILKENPAEKFNLTVPYLKHFQVKTVEEYFTNKMNRGLPFSDFEILNVISKDYFFNHNDWNILKEIVADYYIYQHYNETVKN